ncbi:hypothetical protein H2248_007705, partial [Termitomyces sp. 'cryptogamus']
QEEAELAFHNLTDSKETAHVVFCAGVCHEEYFISEDILEQAEKAIHIVMEHYSHKDHVFVYDNATTHLKHADEALSATKMPKRSSRCVEKNFGVFVNMLGTDGWPLQDAEGKIYKEEDFYEK